MGVSATTADSFTVTELLSLSQALAGLGFNNYKIGSVTELSADFREYYDTFLREHNQGALPYLQNTEVKYNVEKIFSPCHSILALSLPYLHHETKEALKNSRYKIARYAWGKDYHNVVKKILRPIAQQYGRARIVCDSTPLPERFIARRLNLGFIGRNGMLINSEQGSYFFLVFVLFEKKIPVNISQILSENSELATFIITKQRTVADLLQNDFLEHCKKCRRCIDACPTQAIQNNGYLNIADCISFKTIENKKPSNSYKSSDKKHRWIFGCDICQMVCPYNRNTILTKHEDFAPSISALALARGGDSSLDGMADNDLHGSALKRAGIVGLRRNIKACDEFDA